MTAALSGNEVFTADRLEAVFGRCFESAEQTRLTGGADEPLYEPASEPGAMHTIHYREDFFASALHEVSHWCIAGPLRRAQRDFGYWYAPEGRDRDSQRAFEAVEEKPQALEWLFSLACAYPFQVSVDNLDPDSGALPDTLPFRTRVFERAMGWQQHGLPSRAAVFFSALASEFSTGVTLQSLELKLADLR